MGNKRIKIKEIFPQKLEPGSPLYILGSGFGNDVELVVIGNRKIRSSDKLIDIWSDERIELNLPLNISNGAYDLLVFNKSEYAKSSQQVIVENSIPISLPLESIYKNSHAIVIGISDYKEETPLSNAYNDAKRMESILKEYYKFDKVYCFYNAQATHGNLRELFVDFIQDSNKISYDDRVVIYYSGHGKLRRRINRIGEEIKEGYLIPYDAKKDRYSSYLDMQEVIRNCKGCNAKHVLVILDCCYSGFAAVKGDPHTVVEDPTDLYLKNITDKKAFQILAASQDDQVAHDSGPNPQHSLFSGILIDVLMREARKNQNHVLTARKVADMVENTFIDQRIIEQKPVYTHLSGSEFGDFVFNNFYTAFSFSPEQLMDTPYYDDKEEEIDFGLFDITCASSFDNNDSYVTYEKNSVLIVFSREQKLLYNLNEEMMEKLISFVTVLSTIRRIEGQETSDKLCDLEITYPMGEGKAHLIKMNYTGYADYTGLVNIL